MDKNIKVHITPEHIASLMETDLNTYDRGGGKFQHGGLPDYLFIQLQLLMEIRDLLEEIRGPKTPENGSA